MEIVITRMVKTANGVTGGKGQVELHNEQGERVHSQKFSGKIETGEYVSKVYLENHTGKCTATFTPLEDSIFEGYFVDG